MMFKWCALAVLVFGPAAVARAETWGQYHGFNAMSPQEQREIVLGDLRAMRDHYEGLCFEGQLKVAEARSVIADPFSRGAGQESSRPKVLSTDSQFLVDFVAGAGRIKVRGSTLAVEGGRSHRVKRLFSLQGGVAQTLFYRDGKPIRLQKKCESIAIQNSSSLRVFLWVTSPELAEFTSLSRETRDDLSRLVRNATEFETKAFSDRPSEVYVRSEMGQDPLRTTEDVFLLGDRFRWVRSASTLYLEEKTINRAWSIEYGNSFGLECPEAWSRANWQERVSGQGEPAQMIEGSLSEERVVLTSLEVFDEAPASKFAMDIPDDIKVVDECNGGMRQAASSSSLAIWALMIGVICLGSGGLIWKLRRGGAAGA